MLGDQPLVGPAAVERLLASFRSDRPSVVAPEYGETVGGPAIFRRDLFPQPLSLADDEGAKRVMLAAEDNAVRTPLAGAVFDIDTPADYTMLTAVESVDGRVQPVPAYAPQSDDDNQLSH